MRIFLSMMLRLILSVVALFSAASTPALAQNGDEASTPAFLDLAWADLLPEGEAERINRLMQLQALQQGFDHFGTDRMPQLQTFEVVDELDGRRVRIGGYVLPFDFTGSREISRFLLVPYVGACIHVPPPPPNQLVFVTTAEPIQVQGLWDPVFVEGIMRTQRHDNELGDTAYTLELIEMTPYRP
jgi:hypothetical protein